jgi:hypothetical protein
MSLLVLVVLKKSCQHLLRTRKGQEASIGEKLTYHAKVARALCLSVYIRLAEGPALPGHKERVHV